MHRLIDVDLGERSYRIDVLGTGGSLSEFQAVLSWRNGQTGGDACVVSNANVRALWGAPLQQILAQSHHNVISFDLPEGEQYKTLEHIEALIGFMLSKGLDRKAVIYALGGGVVGDMAGFAAACYQRGIRFVQIPTTLLAMVDSSVGGKTGVNHALGKNMIGAFHQPSHVVCDVRTLSTLPEREYNSGLAEVIKYGAIIDPAFFAWLERNMDALLARDDAALIHAVARSCELKAHVVAQDEREAGLREVLNFGHTFGHAIETGMGYGTWWHGEAVAAGMVMGAELSQRLGLIDANIVMRLRALLKHANLPVHGPSAMAAADYLPHMRVDKKARDGQIRYVVLNALGKARTQPAPDAMALDAIQACLAGG